MPAKSKPIKHYELILKMKVAKNALGVVERDVKRLKNWYGVEAFNLVVNEVHDDDVENAPTTTKED